MPKILTENLGIKAFALVLAVVSWMAVHGEEERVKDFAVPLDYVNLPPTLDISGKVADTVAIRLRASEPVLRTITEDRLGAAIDLSRATLGEQHIHLSPDMLKVPGGASVERVEPDVITLRIDKKVTREVPIVAEFAGKPPKGYQKTGHTIEPAVVTVVGPASEVEEVSRAMTGTIVLEGETADLDIVVRPIPDIPPGSRVRILSPQGPVRVHVSIQKNS